MPFPLPASESPSPHDLSPDWTNTVIFGPTISRPLHLPSPCSHKQKSLRTTSLPLPRHPTHVIPTQITQITATPTSTCNGPRWHHRRWHNRHSPPPHRRHDIRQHPRAQEEVQDVSKVFILIRQQEFIAETARAAASTAHFDAGRSAFRVAWRQAQHGTCTGGQVGALLEGRNYYHLLCYGLGLGHTSSLQMIIF